MRRWKTHDRQIESLSFSRDGRLLASLTRSLPTSGLYSEMHVTIWDPTAGELVRIIEKAEGSYRRRFQPQALTFASDAELLVLADSDRVEVWDVNTWELRSYVDGLGNFGLDFPLAVSCGANPLIVTARRNYQKVCVWELPKKSGSSLKAVSSWRTSSLAEVAFSSDGSELLLNTWARHSVVSVPSHTVEVWNARRGRLLRSRNSPFANTPEQDCLIAVRFSPDGSRIAFRSAKALESRPASLDDSDDVIRYVGHSDLVWHIHYTPDGRSLISASSDGTARVWDADSGAEKRCFEFDVGKMLAADVSPDGTVAAVGGATGEIIVWDLDD